MPVAEQPQHLTALARANEKRFARAKERRELRAAPVKRIVEAITKPTPALASYTLEQLFGQAESAGKARGIVEGFRRGSLNKALNEIAGERRVGRRRWHSNLKLSELTENERIALARAVVKHAPRAWREAA